MEMKNLYIFTIFAFLVWGFFSCNLSINTPYEEIEEMDIEDEYLAK